MGPEGLQSADVSMSNCLDQGCRVGGFGVWKISLYTYCNCGEGGHTSCYCKAPWLAKVRVEHEEWPGCRIRERVGFF